MSKTTRTSKKQIHELEAMARETIDKSARLYARNEYDATGKAYAVINGTRTAYASNTALYDAVAETVLTKQAEEFQSEPEPERIMQNVAGHTIYKHISGSEIYYTVSDVEGLEFWTVAEARHYAQCSPTAESLETIAAATAAALQAAEKAEQAKAETLAAREAGDESAAAKHAQEAATYAQAASKASSDAYHASGNRVNATAHEADIRANEAASIAIRAYYETREDLAAAEAAAPAAFDEYANCEDLVNAIAYDAFEATHYYGARPETAEELEQLDRLMGYATKIVKRDGPAYSIEWEPYQVCEFPAPYLVWEDRPETETAENYAAEDAATSLINAYADAIGERPLETDPETRAAYRVAGDEIAGTSDRATADDRETVAAMVERIAQAVRDDIPTGPENYRPTYQRAELLAYLGEPDDYDVTAIEHDATAYDAATGRTVWAVDAETLAVIAERHQLQFYAPAF